MEMPGTPKTLTGLGHLNVSTEKGSAPLTSSLPAS